MSQGHPHSVDVVATPCGDGFEFHMRHGGKTVSRLEFRKKNGMKKQDWHDVSFVLDDPGGTLVFHPDGRDAIWIARGTQGDAPPCPNERSADPEDEVGRAKVVAGGRTLKLRNSNPRCCLFSFRLNFVARDGSKGVVAFYDPIIDNRNGGSV